MHDSDKAFITSQKYTFNVHQITTSCGKFNIFLARTQTKIPLIMQQNTLFRVKIHFFRGWGSPLPRPLPQVGRGTSFQYPTVASIKTSGSAPASPRIPARFTSLPRPINLVPHLFSDGCAPGWRTSDGIRGRFWRQPRPSCRHAASHVRCWTPAVCHEVATTVDLCPASV